MAKGLCCAAQAAGDLGKPLIVTFHHHDPTTGAILGTAYQRCGVCEVGPSCSNPQKTVFKFRLLHNNACGLPSKAKCPVTSAGIAQYASERSAAATRPQVPVAVNPATGAFTFGTLSPTAAPYTLPVG